MLKYLYETQTGYYYNLRNGKLFLPSKNLKELLDSIQNENELNDKIKSKSIDEESYNLISRLLFSKKNNSSNTSLLQLTLIVTNECNMNCKYCYATSGQYGYTPEKMSFETAKLILDTLFKKYNYIKTIMFFGGQPLINSKLISEVCDYISEKYSGRYSSLTMMSNLLKIDDDIIQMIKKYHIHVSTSLDGSKECHDTYRIDLAGKGTYQRVVDNIRLLQKQTGEPTTIEATLSDIHNKLNLNKYDVIKYLYENFNAKFCAAVEVCPIEGKGVDYYKNSNSLEDEISQSINLYVDFGIVSEYLMDFLQIIQGGMVEKQLCNAGFAQITIMPNGDIYPCQLFAAAGKEFCMGNIYTDFHKKESLVKMKLSKADKTLNPACLECEINMICTSCIGNNYIMFQNFFPSSACCEEKRQKTFILIEEYSKLYNDKKKWQKFKNQIRKDKKIWEKL